MLESRYDSEAALLVAPAAKDVDAITKLRRSPAVGRRRSGDAVAVVERGGPEAARESKVVAGDVTDRALLIRALEVERIASAGLRNVQLEAALDRKTEVVLRRLWEVAIRRFVQRRSPAQLTLYARYRLVRS